jgi:L-fucose isomerase-like protein
MFRNHEFFMKRATDKKPCLGVIYGNRDFFPDQLVSEARADIARVFEKAGIHAIQFGEKASKLGGVETHADARKCAGRFRKHADEIDGVLVVLPNFGDEKGVADTLKLSKLTSMAMNSTFGGLPLPASAWLTTCPAMRSAKMVTACRRQQIADRMGYLGERMPIRA